MEYLLMRRGKFPSEYRRLPEGEKVVIRELFMDFMNRQKGW